MVLTKYENIQRFTINLCKSKTKGNIPTEVVKMVDEADSFEVRLSKPPKFNC